MNSQVALSRVTIEPCSSADEPGWLELRASLWQHCLVDEHREAMRQQIEAPQRVHALIARDGQLNRSSQAMHRALGFAETERVVFFRKTMD